MTDEEAETADRAEFPRLWSWWDRLEPYQQGHHRKWWNVRLELARADRTPSPTPNPRSRHERRTD